MAHATHGHASAERQAAVWGLMAEFRDPAALARAAEQVREAGYRKWDVYSPFPVHGMDEAMGLKPSRVTFIMGFMAATGLASAVLMQWWMGEVDYPIVVAGKPLFAWEAAMPIIFELSVLFAAFGGVFGMLILNLLPRWNHPLFSNERFLRVSDDRFVIAIEADDPKFDERSARSLLERLGGMHVERVEEAA